MAAHGWNKICKCIRLCHRPGGCSAELARWKSPTCPRPMARDLGSAVRVGSTLTSEARQAVRTDWV